MYLSKEELKELLDNISENFDNVAFILDAYSKRTVKFLKIKKSSKLNECSNKVVVWIIQKKLKN